MNLKFFLTRKDIGEKELLEFFVHKPLAEKINLRYTGTCVACRTILGRGSVGWHRAVGEDHNGVACEKCREYYVRNFDVAKIELSTEMSAWNALDHRIKKTTSDDEVILNLPADEEKQKIKEENQKIKEQEQEQHKSTDEKNLKDVGSQKLDDGIKEIQKKLLIDRPVIEQIVSNLQAGNHILLAGPIGTGKSELAKLIPKIIFEKDVELVTATYEWSATDVVGGLKPNTGSDSTNWIEVDGCVPRTIKADKWLIIDEFNRADIDKAMGKLFSSLVDGKISKEDGSKPLEIPSDYRIIGTLNTADKYHLNILSSALLRRFAYVEVDPPTDSKKEQEFALEKAKRELRMEKMGFGDEPDRIYEIFQKVRREKMLGTAVLISMYKTMLSQLLINPNSHQKAVDFAITSHLIPQLWGANSAFLEVLKGLFNNIGLFALEKSKEIQKNPSLLDRYAKQLSSIGIGNPKIDWKETLLKPDEQLLESVRVTSLEKLQIPHFKAALDKEIKASGFD